MDAREYVNWMTNFYGLKPIGVEINPDLLARKHLKGAFDAARNTIILKRPLIQTAEDMSVIWHEFTEKIAPWLKHPGQSIDLRGMPGEEWLWAPYAKGGKISVGAGDATKEGEIAFDFAVRVKEIQIKASAHVNDAYFKAWIDAINEQQVLFEEVYDIENLTIPLAATPEGANEIRPKNKAKLQIIKPTTGTAQEIRWMVIGWRKYKK